MKELKILNETDFTTNLFKYTKDRNKLPFIKFKFDLKTYLGIIKKYNPSVDFYQGKQKIKLLGIKKENSLLNQDIYFEFLKNGNRLKMLV